MPALRYFLLLMITLPQLTASCEPIPNQPLVIGHRGAMGHALENTLQSIDKAFELGVDMIEIDVFVIRSGELVVFHDDSLSRLSPQQGLVTELDTQSWKALRLNDGQAIPSLAEVIDRVNRRVPINIELKGPDTAEPVHALLEQYYQKGWKPSDFLISSFRWEELRKIHALQPNIPIGVLTADVDPLTAVPMAKELQAVSVNPLWTTLNRENVSLLHKAGFKVFPYTVNEPEDLKRIIQMGVDGIFCNFPERLR